MGENIVSGLPVVVHVSCGPDWDDKPDRRRFHFYHVTRDYLKFDELEQAYKQLGDYIQLEKSVKQ